MSGDVSHTPLSRPQSRLAILLTAPEEGRKALKKENSTAASFRTFSSGNIVVPGLGNRMIAEPSSLYVMRNNALNILALGCPNSREMLLRCFKTNLPIAVKVSGSSILSVMVSEIASLCSQRTSSHMRVHMILRLALDCN